jgi:7,8-dihydropterin-6-yl-methyl-4-(beta-D-ribofuranosyl)aminobenzene 5'-phosphate synthase
LITGEVDRTTDFERGMPNQDAWRDGRWEPDPLILDEQALVVHVRGRGLVVITGSGHAGAINIARHAMRLTGVDRIHPLLGGFHLSGAAFEPAIDPAQHRLAEALPTAFVPNAVGTSFSLAGA